MWATMTTYVMHGGETSRNTPDNEEFFKLFTSLTAESMVKILMCYWAREPERWDDLLHRDTSKILDHTGKPVIIDLVHEPQDLLDKLPFYDVLYIAGGEAEPIERLLPHLSDLHRYLNGKVYIGSSMGAFIASKNYVLSHDSPKDNEVHQGLGLLPINSLCHWNIEEKKQEKLSLLHAHDPNSPIITLDESKWVILYE